VNIDQIVGSIALANSATYNSVDGFIRGRASGCGRALLLGLPVLKNSFFGRRSSRFQPIQTKFGTQVVVCYKIHLYATFDVNRYRGESRPNENFLIFFVCHRCIAHAVMQLESTDLHDLEVSRSESM